MLTINIDEMLDLLSFAGAEMVNGQRQPRPHGCRGPVSPWAGKMPSCPGWMDIGAA